MRDALAFREGLRQHAVMAPQTHLSSTKKPRPIWSAVFFGSLLPFRLQNREGQSGFLLQV